MQRISVYIISLLLLVAPSTLLAQLQGRVSDPDSVSVTLNIRVGADIARPIMYLIDHNSLIVDGFASFDLNEKHGITLNVGYADYKASDYNFEYKANGMYFKPGFDFNLLKPQVGEGKYWAGIGVRYGLSLFSYETPSLEYTNYWGSITSSVASQTKTAHFLEVAAGFNAKITNNFNLGWRVSIAKMLYSGSAKSITPMYVPGFGQKDKISFGVNYYLSFSFSYKTIKAKFKEDTAGANYDEVDEDSSTSNN